MILHRVIEHYRTDPDLVKRGRPGTGNPTGSKFGSCAAQMQMLRAPALTNPERTSPRGVMTFENGDMIEAWWVALLKQMYGSAVGLQQEPFYLAIGTLDQADNDEMVRRIGLPYGQPGGIWGRTVHNFEPPSVTRDETTGRVKIRHMLPRSTKDPGEAAMWGFVYDPTRRALWAPTFIDVALLDQEIGLAVGEAKAMSSFAFRRATHGDLGYDKRCQLAGIVEATGLTATVLAYRKDTAHLLELMYMPKQERVQVRIARNNGSVETYWVNKGQVIDEQGNPCEMPHESGWDAAEVWTPYDPGLLFQIRARVKRVLLHTPDPVNPLAWDREYGPSFNCPTCEGTGTQLLTKAAPRKPLKTPKACEDCSRTGLLREAPIPTFPCGYCSVRAHCYESVSPTLVLTERPTWMVKRSTWLASGLSFTSPEGPTLGEEGP